MDIIEQILKQIIKKKSTFNFYVYYYDKNEKEFEKAVSLFKIEIEEENDINLANISVRNMHIFSFHYEKKSDKEYSFLISFNNGNNSLLHYVTTKGDEFEPYKLNITSNILFLNRDSDKNVRFVYFDQERKICLLQRDKTKEKKYDCKDNTYNIFDKQLTNKISLDGGVAYVDLNGDCVPDILLSYEDDSNSNRFIDIYLAVNEKQFNYTKTIEVGNASEFGAFAITRVNDKKSSNNAPFLDILIPKLETNEIYHYKNKASMSYSWSKYYCKEEKKVDESDLFDIPIKEPYPLTFPVKDGETIQLKADFPTVIRTGDFLGKSNPGIIVKHNILDSKDNIVDTQISIFERKDGKYIYYGGIKMSEINEKIYNNENVDKTEKLEKGLFFDIDESGTLSFIATSNKGNNYFFFNYKRNIYFIKSKLMNDKDKYYDSNIGALYRYIVTDKKGDRHMDISYQLIQTSDMNIPLPFSFMGLDDTNNYVEYFQTISGNVLKNVKWAKGEDKNYKGNSPIIPNTQMMISKYYSGSKIEWNVDLIVQPMEKIWLFLIIVILVLLIVLSIIIYLHLKEVKEEQKETNKFKSWFA